MVQNTDMLVPTLWRGVLEDPAELFLVKKFSRGF